MTISNGLLTNSTRKSARYTAFAEKYHTLETRALASVPSRVRTPCTLAAVAFGDQKQKKRQKTGTKHTLENQATRHGQAWHQSAILLASKSSEKQPCHAKNFRRAPRSLQVSLYSGGHALMERQRLARFQSLRFSCQVCSLTATAFGASLPSGKSGMC